MKILNKQTQLQNTLWVIIRGLLNLIDRIITKIIKIVLNYAKFLLYAAITLLVICILTFRNNGVKVLEDINGTTYYCINNGCIKSFTLKNDEYDKLLKIQQDRGKNFRIQIKDQSVKTQKLTYDIEGGK